MKKLLVSFLALVSLVVFAAPNWNKEDVVGTWLNEDGDGKIRFYQAKNGKYYGKLVWMEEPKEEDGSDKKDKNNPDPGKRGELLQDMVIFKGFKWDDGEWDDGEVYDPQNGKTYSCYMELEGYNKLKVRGYIGMSLIGRTAYFTRVTN